MVYVRKMGRIVLRLISQTGIASGILASSLIGCQNQRELRAPSPSDRQLLESGQPLLAFTPLRSASFGRREITEILRKCLPNHAKDRETYSVDLIHLDKFLPTSVQRYAGRESWVSAHLGPFVDDYDLDGKDDVIVLAARRTRRTGDWADPQYAHLFDPTYASTRFKDGVWRTVEALVLSDSDGGWRLRQIFDLGVSFVIGQPFEEYRRYLRAIGREDPRVDIESGTPGLRLYSCLNCDGGTSRIFWDGDEFVREHDAEPDHKVTVPKN